jgi:mRNA interferase HigB
MARHVPKYGTPEGRMQIIAKRTLKRFWEKHAQAEGPLRSWYAVVDQAQWNGPPDVKIAFGASVDCVRDNRLVFDIAGNKYRLVVHVAYRFKRVLIKFVGTHKEYDRIDAESV